MPLIKQPSQLLAAFGKIAFTALVVWLIILSASGCYPVRKMERQVSRGHYTYPNEFAMLVTGWYPPIKISERTETKLKPGVRDTPRIVVINCDSAVRAAKISGKPAIVRQPCPPSNSTPDTVETTTTITVQDSLAMAAKNAVIYGLQSRVDSNQRQLLTTTVELSQMREYRNAWRTYAICLGIAFLILLAICIWRFFSGLAAARVISGKIPS